METQAILRGVRLSAQKGRLVADMIRGKPVEQALNVLTFSPKKAAKIVKKVLESAIANAEHNDGADIDDLRVTTIYGEQGMTLKRSAGTAMKFYRHKDKWRYLLLYTILALLIYFAPPFAEFWQLLRDPAPWAKLKIGVIPALIEDYLR